MPGKSPSRLDRQIASAVTAIILVAACATTPTRSDAIATRTEQMKTALRDAVDDPGHAGELCKAVDAMQVRAQLAIEALTALNREFVDRNAAYGVERAELDVIAHRIAVTRRDALESMMAERVALRKAMSPTEWRRFADKLPIIEGGAQ